MQAEGDDKEVLASLVDRVTVHRCRHGLLRPAGEDARARDVRRGAVRSFQDSVQPLKARAVAGQSGAVLAERWTRRRFGAELVRQLPLWCEQFVRRADLIGTAARAGAALMAQLAAVVAQRNSGAGTYWQMVRRQSGGRSSDTTQAETQRLR